MLVLVLGRCSGSAIRDVRKNTNISKTNTDSIDQEFLNYLNVTRATALRNAHQSPSALGGDRDRPPRQPSVTRAASEDQKM